MSSFRSFQSLRPLSQWDLPTSGRLPWAFIFFIQIKISWFLLNPTLPVLHDVARRICIHAAHANPFYLLACFALPESSRDWSTCFSDRNKQSLGAFSSKSWKAVQGLSSDALWRGRGNNCSCMKKQTPQDHRWTANWQSFSEFAFGHIILELWNG